MSISARAKHVMSIMLVVVVACPGSAWASIDRTTHCPMQLENCHHRVAVLACCGPTAPTPIDRASLPQCAPSPVHVVSATLMDHSSLHALVPGTGSIRTSRWIRVLDLPILHRSFVI